MLQQRGARFRRQGGAQGTFQNAALERSFPAGSLLT